MKKFNPTVLFLSYSLLKDKRKAKTMLENEEIYNTIGDKELAEAYELLLKEKNSFLNMFKKTKNIPNKPLFLFELSELFFENRNYLDSLRYIDEALKRKKILFKEDGPSWRIKWMQMHKAKVLCKLKKYKSAYYIYRSLIAQKENIGDWQLYEKCKQYVKK